MHGRITKYHSTSGRKISTGSLVLAVFAMVVFVSAAYFIEINSVTSLGFEMKKMQKEVGVLKEENQNAKVYIADMSSFKNIGNEEQAKKMNLVGISEYQYLTVLSSSVAIK